MEFSEAGIRLYNHFGLRRCPTLDGRTIYRSRELSGMDEQDIEAFLALGIAEVLDLRKQTEREKRPDPEIPGILFKATSHDLQDEENRTHETFARNIVKAYGKPGDRMLHTYGVMAGNAPEIGAVLTYIEAGRERGPILVHCANGKDRAGVICACEMRLHGANDSEIMEDYLATNDANAEINARDLARHAKTADEQSLEVLKCMFEARPEYLNRFFEVLDDDWGSFAAFVARCVVC